MPSPLPHLTRLCRHVSIPLQGLTDFDLVKHGALIPHLPLLGLPLSFFTLTGSSLGLLLVFRTNAA